MAMAPNMESRPEHDLELLLRMEPQPGREGAAERPRGLPKRVVALALVLAAAVAVVVVRGQAPDGRSSGAIEANALDSTVSLAQSKREDKKEDEQEPCTETNVAYLPYMLSNPWPAMMLLPTDCEAHCKNITGCEHYTFYPMVPKGMCYVSDKWGIRTPQLSLANMIPPIAGRLCTLKEHAQKISSKVAEQSFKHLEVEITGNLTKAYELCMEEETTYNPFYWFEWKDSSDGCREACTSNEYCAKWTYLHYSKTCQLANNFSMATKGIMGTRSSTKVCEEVAKKNVEEKKKRDQEQKDRFDRAFRRKEYDGRKKKEQEAEEAAKKKAEEEDQEAKKHHHSWFGSNKKKAEDEAAKEKAEEEATKKKAEEEDDEEDEAKKHHHSWFGSNKKKAKEEAAKKKAEEEASKKKAEEEVAKKHHHSRFGKKAESKDGEQVFK